MNHEAAGFVNSAVTQSIGVNAAMTQAILFSLHMPVTILHIKLD